MKENDIVSAYNELNQATRNAYEAGEHLIDVSAALEAAKLNGMLDGSIDGKNAELREASARKLLASQYAEAGNAERRNREAQHWLSIAKIEVDMVRALLRLQEISGVGPSYAP